MCPNQIKADTVLRPNTVFVSCSLCQLDMSGLQCRYRLVPAGNAGHGGNSCRSRERLSEGRIGEGGFQAEKGPTGQR